MIKKFTALLLIIAAAFAVSVNVGYTHIAPAEFLSILRGTASPALTFTLIELRLPRIITAFLVGVGLSLSGSVIQGVSGNDLAEPGILGINAGSSLAVAFLISFFPYSLGTASLAFPIAAFLGAAFTAFLDYVLSYIKGEGISPNRLILTGVAVTAAINAVTVVLLLRMDQSQYSFVEGWRAGNIWGASWENIRMMSLWITVLFALVYYRSRTLNVLLLGPKGATGLGVNVNRERILLLACAVGLSSVCAAVGGGVLFVGLICPHIARQLVGPRYQQLLPASALVGGALMLAADIISRTVVAPDEVSIGIVVAVIGAPYFVWMIGRK